MKISIVIRIKINGNGFEVNCPFCQKINLFNIQKNGYIIISKKCKHFTKIYDNLISMPRAKFEILA